MDRSLETLKLADEQFVADGSNLIRPDSDWSLLHDRRALHGALSEVLLRDAEIAEERARASRVQQQTLHVISKMQSRVDT
eukprot:CAMPEP_0194531444 /NCGR_PEP_ID=MMETSP0253-20130528/68739_1 /TAXON_ID=2966 /ORGANISM="Noctiluca scintillans" /LENGTH=79 /DNA_ID=CAMNT_0039376797 /DNA_START=131 /DNA_END=366 /DNA_ORIENTATION=+